MDVGHNSAMPSRVSVIIPCFNSSRWIRETLGSVVSQGLDDLEVIVVDDGSTDGTGDIIRREFEFVRLVTTPNRGISAARNTGTGLASGMFLQYLDHDDILAEGKLRWQLELLERTRGDVAYGDWRYLELANGGYVPGNVVRAVMKEPELELFDDFWCPPAVYLFRRQIVESVGGWNEELPVIQDARFCLECALRGASFVYSPGVMAYYRVVHDSFSRRDRKMLSQDIYRNACDVHDLWKRRGGITEARRHALTKSLAAAAKDCRNTDGTTLEAILLELERVNPDYLPAQPFRLRLTSRLLGYRRAERVARWYRRFKRFLTHCGVHGNLVY
jgi:glycosyltransferase involved in cell wall biosynthesis